MRVWFINQYATSPRSVGGNRPFSLCRDLVERGHEVVLVCSTFNHLTREDEFPDKGWTYATQTIDGVRFLWIAGIPYETNDLRRVRNMADFTRRLFALKDAERRLGRPDVVLGSTPHLLVPFGAERLADAFGVPFVLEVRDIWPASIVELHGMHRAHPIVLTLGALERHVSTRAAQVVSVLPGGVEHLEEIGVDPERVTWIPNGVDFALVPEPTASPDDEVLTLMFAGSHGASDGLDVMIEAAALLEAGEAAGRLRWRFVGNGPHKPALIEQARRLGLSNVSFEDAVPKGEIYGLLSQAGAFIVTVRDEPLYRFGVSFNKFYDYMAMARPTVVAMESPWNPFLESRSGITVPPDDPAAFAAGVQELLGMSREDRAEMGARGRAFVEEAHDLHRLGGDLEAVLMRAVSP
jgi:glycosyltransferase involved in cell wall biosynthesis